MATYDEPRSFSGGTSTTIYPQAQTVRPEPQSPSALADLSKASQAYAEAASVFINARDNLTDARARWQECRDVVAKVAEAEGIS